MPKFQAGSNETGQFGTDRTGENQWGIFYHKQFDWFLSSPWLGIAQSLLLKQKHVCVISTILIEQK